MSLRSLIGLFRRSPPPCVAGLRCSASLRAASCVPRSPATPPPLLVRARPPPMRAVPPRPAADWGGASVRGGRAPGGDLSAVLSLRSRSGAPRRPVGGSPGRRFGPLRGCFCFCAAGIPMPGRRVAPSLAGCQPETCRTEPRRLRRQGGFAALPSPGRVLPSNSRGHPNVIVVNTRRTSGVHRG